MEPPCTGDPRRRGPGGRSQGSHRTSDMVSRGFEWTAAGIQVPDVAGGGVPPGRTKKASWRVSRASWRGAAAAKPGGRWGGARPAPGLSGLRLAESLGLQFPQFLLSALWAAGRCRTDVPPPPFPLPGSKGVSAAQQRSRPVFGEEAAPNPRALPLLQAASGTSPAA